MNCKNCNTALKDNQNYCFECGAKCIRNRLTPNVLVQQVNEQVLSLDNKLFKTFIDLFKKPEDVIVGYINGTRKKYIDVIQYFAVSLTLAGIQVFLMTTFFKESLELDPSMAKFIENAPSQEDNPFANLNFDVLNNYQGLIYILGLPISAFATWFVYYILNQRRFNFTEHLVVNMYYTAQSIIVTSIISIILLALGINYLYISFLLLFPYLIYLFYILKRVFKESFLETFAKFSIVCFTYVMAYIAIILIFSVIIVLIVLAIR